MSLKKWEKKVLKTRGAERRVSEIESELRLAAGLATLREDAGLTQRDLAKKIGVSQPRVAAIEQSKNVTIDVLQQYLGSLGAELEVSAIKGDKRIPILSSAKKSRHRPATARTKTVGMRKKGATKKAASR
jgi:transcriptional regulator with XRE-family HTH domain